MLSGLLMPWELAGESIWRKGVADLIGVGARTGIPELIMSGVIIPDGLNSGNSNIWSSENAPVGQKKRSI